MAASTLFVLVNILPFIVFFVPECAYASGNLQKNEDCIHAASNSIGLIGGWSSGDYENDEHLKQTVDKLTDDILKEYTFHDKGNKKGILYTRSAKKEITVYTQLVSGMNYCIQFTGDASGCKDGSNSMDCVRGEIECTAKIYTSFSGVAIDSQYKCKDM